MNRLLLVLTILALGACEMDEIPIDPVDRPIEPEEKAPVITNDIELGSDYLYQSYFDLGTNSFVKTTVQNDWEIAFDCEGVAIVLNSSTFMQGATLETTDFSVEPDVKTLEFRAYYPSAPVDSLPFRDLINSDKVGIVDLGIFKNGTSRGHRKIKVGYNETDQTYTLRYAKLDGSKEGSVKIKKNPKKNWAEYNMSLNTAIDASPEKNAYDLYFGQYTYQFYDPYTPYLVVGVLSNPNQVLVAVESDKTFGAITLESVSQMDFSDLPDKIGYEWKYYSFDDAEYIVNSEITYVIKDTEGIYYKLRFLDFYDQFGVKGHPKFQFQQL